LKPLKNSRQQNLNKSRQDLDKKGLKGVASTLVAPDTQGTGKLGIGKLLPLPVAPQEYEPNFTPKGKPSVSPNTVKKFQFLFVKYENTYIPGGDEKLYSFAVIVPLEPMTVNDCASQLGVKVMNVTGLTRAEYRTGTFQHPVYINLGILPQPPYPDFITNQGNTGATAIGIGGTVGFVDASLRNPPTVRPSSWAWDFGGTGASPTGSTAQNPVVTYSATGSYTVSLTASNTTGSTTVTKTNFVTVS